LYCGVFGSVTPEPPLFLLIHYQNFKTNNISLLPYLNMENEIPNLKEFAHLIQNSMLLCDMRKLYGMGEKSFRRKLKIY